MLKNELNKFLDIRETRLSEIEIANKLYVEIGNHIGSESRLKFNNNAYTDGCIYQFFTFMQTQVLFHFIFNNFITIIGNYNTKMDILKSWEEFELTNETINLLKEIRARYSGVRNNLLSHISTNFEPTPEHGVPTSQIAMDVKHIRDILNIVRHQNDIPIVIKGYDVDDHYAVEGMLKLFEQFKLNFVNSEIL